MDWMRCNKSTLTADRTFRLTDTHASIGLIPNEILSNIFEHACLSGALEDEKLSSPVVLSAVCSRWRQIIWDTPILWTSIGPIPPNRPVRRSDVEHLELCLRNSRAHSVSLRLRLDGLPPKRKETKDLLRIAFGDDANASKIRSLSLSPTNSPATWDSIVTALSRSYLPELDSVFFAGRKAPRMLELRLTMPTSLFLYAPNIRAVSFIGYCLHHQPFFDRIMFLSLRRIPIDDCLRLLVECPALKEYSCFQAKPASDSGPSGQGISTKHHLETFEFDSDLPASWGAHLFARFRLPNVRSLSWGTLTPLVREWQDMTWGPFFSSMRSVSSFEYRRYHSEGELIRILWCLGPSVREIKLRSSPGSWESVITALILSERRVPGTYPRALRPVRFCLPVSHPIFNRNVEHIKESLRGLGFDAQFERL